uniref:Uncharacterized protein n=1 Tax=Erwinia amylovora ATCC BAA-2158 TaxID=889211 RepID=E5B6N4_ERWAM|nr:hypothetical protein predicted by Glimmer/Critica [Erwinia amylovora ATCC BAA-2158]
MQYPPLHVHCGSPLSARPSVPCVHQPLKQNPGHLVRIALANAVHVRKHQRRKSTTASASSTARNMMPWIATGSTTCCVSVIAALSDPAAHYAK